MVHLTVLKTDAANTINAHEEHKEALMLSSPALTAVLPFHDEDHWLIGPDTPAHEAYRMLQHEHASFKVVVKDHQTVVGVIDRDQLSEQKLIRRVGAGYKLGELTVSDFMLSQRELFVIGYEEVQRAIVRDLVDVIGRVSKRYGIVLREDDSGAYGIICANYLARRLGVDIRSFEPQPVILDAIVS
jgi:hypothetical protein